MPLLWQSPGKWTYESPRVVVGKKALDFWPKNRKNSCGFPLKIRLKGTYKSISLWDCLLSENLRRQKFFPIVLEKSRYFLPFVLLTKREREREREELFFLTNNKHFAQKKKKKKKKKKKNDFARCSLVVSVLLVVAPRTRVEEDEDEEKERRERERDLKSERRDVSFFFFFS